MPALLPDVYYGEAGTAAPDWRGSSKDIGPDDDAELLETPPDVVELLGFDPTGAKFRDAAPGTGDES